MATFAELVDEVRLVRGLPANKCTFYSVIRPGQTKTEFELWLEKLAYLNEVKAEVNEITPDPNQRLREQYSDIIVWINEFGKRGAKPKNFRAERGANALSVTPNSLPCLRLYCIRLTDSILILLNGDFKTTNNPEVCPNVAIHFRFAIRLADAVDEAIRPNKYSYSPLDASRPKLLTSPDGSIIIG